MADIITTLHPENQAQDNLYPNIKPENIPPQAITGDRLAQGSVTTEKMVDGTVTADKLAENSVGTNKIIDGSVTTPKILNGAVTGEKLADGIIGTTKLTDGSVTTSKIANANVTGDKIASGAIGIAKLDEYLNNYITYLLGLTTGSFTEVKSFTGSETQDNAPMGIRKSQGQSGSPFDNEWVLYQTYYYDNEHTYGWQLALNMNANQIAYRYKRADTGWSGWTYLGIPKRLGQSSGNNWQYLPTNAKVAFVSIEYGNNICPATIYLHTQVSGISVIEIGNPSFYCTLQFNADNNAIRLYASSKYISDCWTQVWYY